MGVGLAESNANGSTVVSSTAIDSGVVTAEIRWVTPLVLLKAYYFFSFTFAATYVRFMTLYFEKDGLGAAEIGIIWSIARTISTLSTPFWSGVADRTKRARTMSLCSLAVGILPFFAMAIPLSPRVSRFWPRGIAFWLFTLCNSPQAVLMDALAIAGSENDTEMWGKARVYGAIGWGTVHLFLGPLIDSVGFAAMFVSFLLFACALALVTRRAVPEACGQIKKDVTWRAVFEIFSRNRIFFVNIIAIGAGFSMVEGMLFLLLRELQASNLMCGLSVVVTVVFELPIFHYAKLMLAKCGARRMILLGQGAWVVRALFYSQMTAAWMVLLIEPLHGLTFALVWTAATQHIADPRVSGEGFEASAQGVLQACFHGVGPILGLSVGGVLFDAIGSHAVYAFFSIVVLLAGVPYFWWTTDLPPKHAGTGSFPAPVSLGMKHVPLDEDSVFDECTASSPISHQVSLEL
eukprot:TRINITY_DN49297_c0_g1_i1.p1 TRINITY_DN49297_c0_g1~~TRINITY_DN49297_c0_g1_i1.p1  ORF type:complete len:462 (-),score=29.80 TRINITY_DN49297_c0_g1_i1:233-1618(-)